MIAKVQITTGIGYIDWIVIGTYLLAMVGLGLWLARKTATGEDYFLGGRRIPPLIAAMSIMATQTSTISLIGAPAFVALRSGGGLRWLQYEVALPLAMFLLMVWLVPLLWKSGVVTIYEYLERRFGVSARLLLSGVFLLSRSLATGVTIYATAIVMNVATGAPLWVLIAIIGGVCLIYSTLGGLVADVYTDSIQLVVLWGAVILSFFVAVFEAGGFGTLSSLGPDVSTALDFSRHGLGDGADFGFWPLAIGGIFLYMSYYGTDQTQVQRVLAAPSVESARRSLFYNGLMRFPLVLCYCGFGLALAALATQHPQLKEAVPADHLDYLVPLFIVNYLPAGVIGIIIAGMMAASMSSLDSTFNSLSAATMRDFIERFGFIKSSSQRKYLITARAVTFAWGMLCCLFAFLVGDISKTVIESINKIGSVFYGPVLGVFLLAFLTRFVTTIPAIVGLITGVGLNMFLWAKVPSISWLWWNLFGLLATLIVACLLSFVVKEKGKMDASVKKTESVRTSRKEVIQYVILLLFTGVIIIVSWALGQLVK